MPEQRGVLFAVWHDRRTCNAAFANSTDTVSPGTRSNPDSLYGVSFGGVLQQMHEPSLLRQRVTDSSAIMRFFYMRSFHPTIAVRVSTIDEHCDVTTTVLSLSQPIWGPQDTAGRSGYSNAWTAVGALCWSDGVQHNPTSHVCGGLGSSSSGWGASCR